MAAYADEVAFQLKSLTQLSDRLSTVYFGGGSPALCDLRNVFEVVKPRLDSSSEFTVEIHPLDVSRQLLERLKAGGVNRISMGMQSLDDAILADMGRGYSFYEAEEKFRCIKEYFDNAGIDLIVGYPGETAALTPRHARLAKWGLRHCSVYSLMVEEKTPLGKSVRNGSVVVPDDETVMNRLQVVAAFLGELGLERYEISNYASPGFECRHNLSVWRGEDYVGLGDGACGRMGLKRTVNYRFRGESIEELTPEQDRKERSIFALRTREGLDARDFPQWKAPLDRFVEEGLLTREASVYKLTDRGREVCDVILAEIV